MPIEFCAGKYGVENRGFVSFVEGGEAHASWNRLVDRAWKQKAAQSVAIYVPTTSRAWRGDLGLPAPDEHHVGRIAGVLEIPPPPTPHIWKRWGFDRWKEGVPCGNVKVLRYPIDPKDLLDDAQWQTFLSYMQNSILFDIRGAVAEAIEQQLAAEAFDVCRPKMWFHFANKVIDVSGWQAAVQNHNDSHWKDGRSAALLAQSWCAAAGPPPPAKAALSTALPDLVFSDGFVEHKSATPGKGGATTTDLLVEARSAQGTVVIAVEAKVDEGFDHRIGCWVESGTSDGSAANRRLRWTKMANDLGLPGSGLEWLRYQLLHRAWVALGEARQRKAAAALMMVHSFDGERRSGWEDFKAFATLLLQGSEPWPDVPLQVRNGEPSLWLVWVTDRGGAAAPERKCSACASFSH